MKNWSACSIVELSSNEDVEDKMFEHGMKHRSIPSGKGAGGLGRYNVGKVQ